MNDAILRAATYYKARGERGLREQIKKELHESRMYLEAYIGRNRLAKQ